MPTYLEFYWFTCPVGHKFLITPKESKGGIDIACEHFSCDWLGTVGDGALGELEKVEDAFKYLRG